MQSKFIFFAQSTKANIQDLRRWNVAFAPEAPPQTPYVSSRATALAIIIILDDGIQVTPQPHTITPVVMTLEVPGPWVTYPKVSILSCKESKIAKPSILVTECQILSQNYNLE